MQAVIIGSGIGGMTAALYLLRAGHGVRVFEQHSEPGGVTGSLREGGFTWDLGQLVVEGFGPGEQVGSILEELGIEDRIELIRDDRVYAFPDFVLDKPEAYGGPWWRQERLAELFPEERGGLARYYRLYRRMLEVMTLARLAERASGVRAALLNARMWLKLLPLLPRRSWSAERLLADLFDSERLRAVFSSILADFVVLPSEFLGLAIPAVNPETAFDKRVPLRISRCGLQPSYHYVRGGVGALSSVMLEEIEKAGGRIDTACPIEQILVEDDAVRGVLTQAGERVESDLVLVSGGARESLVGLAGREHFDADFLARVDGIRLMESVFMVHLGVDFDPMVHQGCATTYYYGTYDIERGVDDTRRGRYHEGKHGFVLYVPSHHTPEMAPPGQHSVTVYTIAPNQLASGSWSERREELADKLLAEAEQFVPGLREHTTLRVILTPEDFRRRTHLRHHAFGGCAPVMGEAGVPHETPIRGLWFIGAQSESGAGMNNVMHGSWRVARRIGDASPGAGLTRGDPGATS